MKSTPQRKPVRNKQSSAPVRKATAPPPAKTAHTLTPSQQARMHRVQTAIGYGVVGVSVLAAVVLSAARQIPVPVGFGLILLAIFRFVALKRELKNQAAEQV